MKENEKKPESKVKPDIQAIKALNEDKKKALHTHQIVRK